jgi:hypothetical protein
MATINTALENAAKEHDVYADLLYLYILNPFDEVVLITLKTILKTWAENNPDSVLRILKDAHIINKATETVL